MDGKFQARAGFAGSHDERVVFEMRSERSFRFSCAWHAKLNRRTEKAVRRWPPE